MKVEIFTHRNCTECHIVLDFLKEKGLLDKVDVIDTEKYPFMAFERGVISTPSIFVDGELIFAGQVDLVELEKILNGEKINKKISEQDLINKLMEGIVDSFAATAWIYVNNDLPHFVEQKDFVMAVTGIINDEKRDELYEALKEGVKANGIELLDKWKERMKRNISSNFIREMYWLYQRKLSKEEVSSKYPLEVFAHWLMVRGGALGRVGLRIYPLSDSAVLSRISEVYLYVFENYDQLWNKVINEQRKLEEGEVLNS
jgi:predicted thioredoxin/glutaredoxin